MGTEIIIGVLIVVVFFALRGAVKHMKGAGGCCGGGSVPKKAKKQKQSSVAEIRTIKVEGMHCEQCSRRVENELNALPGVNATVSFRKGEAVVKMREVLSDEILQETVRKALQD